MTNAAKTGINTPAIVAAREAYAARFDSISDAIEFENFVLGIGREFLPACALAVIDERADVDAPSAETVEYYEWLLEQAKEAHEAADGDESEDDGKLTLDAATVAAISTTKTVLDVPVCPVCDHDEGHPECTCESLQPAHGPLAEFTFAPRLQYQPATEWKDLPVEMKGNGGALADALQHSLQARAINELAQAALSRAEDARLIATVESAYEAAKGTWTGRTWEDGDKITPERTDDSIAGMLTRGDRIGVTCWGVDESDESYRRRVKTAIAKLEAAWAREDDGAADFSAACEALRELAEESDAGVAARAAVAEQDAAEAIKEARAGNKHSALVHAEHAAKVESEFGDAPTWGPFEQAMRAFYEHETE